MAQATLEKPVNIGKPAPVDYPIIPAIQNRWSPRSLLSNPLSPQQMGSLLEAFRWAPSCFNEQPWRVFVGRSTCSPNTLETLRTLLMEGNSWAKRAPVLLLTCAEQNFAKTGEFNRHANHDTGMALAYLCAQATAMGLATHNMAGFDHERAKGELALPPSVEPLTMVAIGYEGPPEQLEVDWQREAELAPRSRKPMQNWLFRSTYGQAFGGLANSVE